MASKKKATKGPTAAEVRAEVRRRKRELPSKVKLLKAELSAKIAKLKASHTQAVAFLRGRCTVAAVKRTSGATWGKGRRFA